MIYFLKLFIFSSLISSLYTQNLRERTGPRRPRQGRKYRAMSSPHEMISKALTINYPLHFFRLDAEEWRRKAKYDDKFARETEPNRDWINHVKAQDQEDIWLYENWFYGMKNGLMIESGALDGELFSMSSLMENFANWTAIHVEADPENYFNLKLNRPKAVNVHGALCSEPRLLHYSSSGVIPVRGFIEFMTPSFIKQWHGKVYNNRTRIEDLPTVQCLPMKLLLRELNVKYVDLWVLDVEGAEESVLQGTDFTEVRFNAVAMECDEHDTEKNIRKKKILEDNNFICTDVDRNCMCRHRDFVPSEIREKTSLKKWNGHNWV